VKQLSFILDVISFDDDVGVPSTEYHWDNHDEDQTIPCTEYHEEDPRPFLALEFLAMRWCFGSFEDCCRRRRMFVPVHVVPRSFCLSPKEYLPSLEPDKQIEPSTFSTD
jgi:hypothetical protein